MDAKDDGWGDAAVTREKRDKEMSRRARLVAFLVGIAAIVAFDQASKAHVRAHLAGPGASMPGIPGLFDLTLVYNDGAAFGTMSGGRVAFVVLACAIAAAVVVYLLRASRVSGWTLASLTLVVGGAAGNAIDRVISGYVTDFVDLAFMDFAVFNFADMCITCGCVLFVIVMLAEGASSRPHGAEPSGPDAARSEGTGEGEGR